MSLPHLTHMIARSRQPTRTLWRARSSRRLCAATASPGYSLIESASPPHPGSGAVRIWATGSGPPSALLVPPLAPQARGTWRPWAQVGLKLQQYGGHDGSKLRGRAVWIADWEGLGDTSPPVNGKAGDAGRIGLTLLRNGPDIGGGAVLHVDALAEVFARALKLGELRLIAGAGNAGMLVPRALRLLRQRGGATGKTGELSIAAVAPAGWQAPLPSRFGEAYPAKLARRQRFGCTVFLAMAALGMEGALGRWLVPHVPEAEPSLAVAWWLGLLDPALRTSDMVREIALASRAVDQDAAAALLRARHAEAGRQDVLIDELEDEDFAVGPAAASSQLRSTQVSSSRVDKSEEALGSTSAAVKRSPLSGSAVRTLLLLPDRTTDAQHEALQDLKLTIQRLRERLGHVFAEQGAGSSEYQIEAELFRQLLELDGGAAGALRAAPPGVECTAECAAVVDATLPVQLADVRGSLACLEERPGDIAEKLATLLAKG